MSENLNRVEVHGCIVCGKLHNVLVVYTPSGELVGYTATGGGAHPIPGADPPLVACNDHTPEQISAALARHHTGLEEDEGEQED
jgi:hypothetical protein